MDLCPTWLRSRRFVVYYEGGHCGCRNLEVITRDRPTEEPTTLARVEKGKELESLVDELIKGMEELQLSFSKLEKIENLQSKKA